MAVDTRNKRASCLGLELAFRLVLPNPDGTVDSSDRLQCSYCYAGIATAAVVDGPFSLAAYIVTAPGAKARQPQHNRTLKRHATAPGADARQVRVYD